MRHRRLVKRSALPKLGLVDVVELGGYVAESGDPGDDIILVDYDEARTWMQRQEKEKEDG